jgi:magnesium-transporting ATPase (P-type)
LETGRRSEMGKIGQALQTIVLEQPRLQAQLRWLVRDFAMAGLIVAGLSVLLFGFLRGSWLQAGLAALPSACRYCRRKYRSCWLCLWRWAPGAFLAFAF